MMTWPHGYIAFTVKQSHLKMLQRLNIGLNNHCSYYEPGYGAPGAGEKRPFGNSDWKGDVAEIIGIKRPDIQDGDQAADVFNALCHQALIECGWALEVCLQALDFRIGDYVRDNALTGIWRRK